MSIVALYKEFNPVRAVRLVQDETCPPSDRLLAASMLFTWMLWPRNGQAHIRRSARITAFQLFLARQLKFERKLRKRRSLTRAVNELYGPAFHRFMLQIFLPLGGARRVLNTASSKYFEKKIEERWAKARTAAIVFDFLLRYDSEFGTRRGGPSVNKAVFFVDAGNYGADYACHPSTGKQRWSEWSLVSPLLFACWKLGNPLRDLLGPLSSPDREAAALNGVTALIDTAITAASMMPKNNGLTLFPDNTIQAAIPAALELKPFAPDDRKAIQDYRAPKQQDGRGGFRSGSATKLPDPTTSR